MSMRAGLWTGLPDLDAAEHRYQVVACDGDVDTLIRLLSRPECNDGSLDHFGRDLTPEGDQDHNVVLAVRDGWGYMYYVDNAFMGWPKGSPGAPYVNEKYTDFPPGVGVPLDVFRQLLIEFMISGERPTGVDWYSEADLFHSWRDQQMALRTGDSR
ncbi:Imm1 family immunity protein [Lentzea sp. CA-135723]|uniref:Imm1 family immunity protein n=1 Tax=Lentzea sp. CA-135723 TaxID=3239950 RepID=UPI003D92DAC5